MRRARALALSCCVAILIQSRSTAGAQPAVPDVHALRSTPGAPWTELASPHFTLLAEDPVVAHALRDSLEVAWAAAARLLDAPVRWPSRVTVFAVRSPRRFPGELLSTSRGRTVVGPDSGVIFLVTSDSVRAYARHEVMHAVSARSWGQPHEPWMIEALATMFDPQCQHSSYLAVASDLLREEPKLTASNLGARVMKGVGPNLGSRHKAYALGASFFAFVRDVYGLNTLKQLYTRGVRPGPVPQITSSWRRFVAAASSLYPAVPPALLDRSGCG